MRVWMITSEMAPFSKTGGLADVAGALPAALSALGCEVTAVIPHVPTISAQRFGVTSTGESVEILLDGARRRAEVLEAEAAGGVRVLLVSYPPYFDREGLYGTPFGDHPDNAQRFAFFAHAAIEAARRVAPGPDVVHTHDWQAGLVPLLLKAPEHYGADPSLGGALSVHTIHNLAYQGVFPKELLPGLGIDWRHFHIEGLEFWGKVNFLKAALNAADEVTTVSPTYAREIQEPAFGWGLDGVLRQRAGQGALHGILNGIDVGAWDPAVDATLPAPFTASTLARKARCTAALRQEFGLPEDGRPVVGVVTRLAEQKGVDLLLGLEAALEDLGLCWALLGNGDHRYEVEVAALAARHPSTFGARVGFDDRVARLVYGGSDLFCMPSLFEPCGLGQLIALRYGSLPVVRRTGGLADTVTDIAQPRGDGFVFDDATPDALEAALRRAAAFAKDRRRLAAVRKRAMSRDFSWEASARAYLRLYRGGVPKGD